MRKTSGKALSDKQKEALSAVLKKIERCRKSRSKTLKIGYNGYLTVFPDEIRRLTWLTGLYVECTGIGILPEWIGELENLKVLDIHSNHKIRKLPASLGKLKHLKKLILGGTGIKKLPSCIGRIHSLELLDISIHDIQEAPQCIVNLPALKRIETWNGDISHLPALAAKQHELNIIEAKRRIKNGKKNKSKKLDLSYLYTGELPEELSELYWLEELDLTCNALKQLPDWIGNYRKLTTLSLDSNELTSLPDSIGNLSKLKVISLDLNHLSTLPETFGNLKSLEAFVLWEDDNHPAAEKKYGQGSWFTCLPESFGNLSSLKTFNVMATRLTSLPESFGNLTKLRELSIQECITDDFHFPGTMKNLKALRELTLGGFNHVPDFVKELKDLTALDISHNRLYDLPDFMGNLTKLKSLNLHSTWIKELPDWIGNLKNLEDLDISNNDIEVYPEMVKKLPKLKKFLGSYNIFNAGDNKKNNVTKRSKKKNV